MSDPMWDFYEWTRKYRRRQRLYRVAAIIALTLAAWAVVAIVGGLLALFLVTFS